MSWITRFSRVKSGLKILARVKVQGSYEKSDYQSFFLHCKIASKSLSFKPRFYAFPPDRQTTDSIPSPIAFSLEGHEKIVLSSIPVTRVSDVMGGRLNITPAGAAASCWALLICVQMRRYDMIEEEGRSCNGHKIQLPSPVSNVCLCKYFILNSLKPIICLI